MSRTLRLLAIVEPVRHDAPLPKRLAEAAGRGLLSEGEALILRPIRLRFSLECQKLNGSDEKRHQNELEFHFRLHTHYNVSR